MIKLKIYLSPSDELEEEKVAGGGIFVTYPEVGRDRAVVAVRTDLRNGHAQDRRGVQDGA